VPGSGRSVTHPIRRHMATVDASPKSGGACLPDGRTERRARRPRRRRPCRAAGGCPVPAAERASLAHGAGHVPMLPVAVVRRLVRGSAWETDPATQGYSLRGAPRSTRPRPRRCPRLHLHGLISLGLSGSLAGRRSGGSNRHAAAVGVRPRKREQARPPIPPFPEACFFNRVLAS
jgi:hypothetical protein